MDIKRLQNLILIAIVLGVFHILEQFFFRFEIAFADVKAIFTRFQGLFDNPDKAFLVLIATLMLLWLFTIYSLIRGGRWQYVVTIIFGLIFTTEIHHPISTLKNLTYYPGTITGLLMFLLGLVFIKESLRIFKQN